MVVKLSQFTGRAGGGLRSRIAPLPKIAAADYRSPEWRAFVGKVIGKRGRVCVMCGHEPKGRVYLDHIVELKDGGALLDEANVQVLCGSHHAAKTAEARKARGAVGRLRR